MLTYLRSFLAAAILLVSATLCAQEIYHVPDPDLMARLSYDTSAAVQGPGVRQICIAVSRSGDYRIARLVGNGQLQRLEGKMPQSELQHLRKLLGATEFQSLSPEHGGLLRQEGEVFGAEILRGERGAKRVRWLNADGESPFPGSVARIVDWLKRFEPTDAEPFEYAENPDVCPSGGLRLLQPSVATNQDR